MQAVANVLGITLHIIESHQKLNFTERTIIEPAVTLQLQGEQRTIYLDHINEVHNVSTAPDVPELFRTQKICYLFITVTNVMY